MKAAADCVSTIWSRFPGGPSCVHNPRSIPVVLPFDRPASGAPSRPARPRDLRKLGVNQVTPAWARTCPLCPIPYLRSAISTRRQYVERKNQPPTMGKPPTMGTGQKAPQTKAGTSNYGDRSNIEPSGSPRSGAEFCHRGRLTASRQLANLVWSPRMGTGQISSRSTPYSEGQIKKAPQTGRR